MKLSTQTLEELRDWCESELEKRSQEMMKPSTPGPIEIPETTVKLTLDSRGYKSNMTDDFYDWMQQITKAVNKLVNNK